MHEAGALKLLNNLTELGIHGTNQRIIDGTRSTVRVHPGFLISHGPVGMN